MLTDTCVLVAKLDIPPLHATDRAMWHLELGYQPGDEYAAQQVLIVDWLFAGDDDGYFDYDEDDLGACSHCGGEGWDQVDDPLWDECDEFGYGPCGSCHGTGERRHQWVF